MTDAEIDALDALHAASDKHGWDVDHDGDLVARVPTCWREGAWQDKQGRANAASIVALHNAWPAVSAELRALRARVAALKGALQWAMDEIDGRTRYPGSDVATPDEQRENCYAIAEAALKGRTDD